MKTLVVADFSDGSLKASTASAAAAAAALGFETDLLIAGSGAASAASEAAKLHGVTRVLTADSAEFGHMAPETLAAQVLACAGGYSHIFFALSHLNRTAMPRVAAKLGVSPLTEISAVENASTFKRQIYAGGVIVTVKTPEGKPVVATVRTTAFDAAPADGNAETASADPVVPAAGNTFVSAELLKSDRPDLLTAKRVVAGGQGLEDEAGFASLEKLADKLGAAIGATRVVVDNNLCPNEWQIGQTGKIVAPDLYIAFGISGALQHLAGMMGSKVIVAVNKDPEAPIFSVADYGIVGDAKTVAEELAGAL